MARHAVEDYPRECCGALLGREAADEPGAGAAREVLRVVPLANRQDSPRNRFLLAAEDVREAERFAREARCELLGWYHSHPDSPARPSEYDRENAWPWYSYVIVSVARGAPGEMASWRLADDRSAFLPEKIEASGADPHLPASIPR
ncbi:MAG: M67 family metallopeptidase [Acidobacteriia bacterium]|nr:M67 family metallopeptidase [Terriglobia bacterium]